MFRTIRIGVGCLAAVFVYASAARGVRPSTNADRRGSYTVHTTINKQYNYHVGVPKNYDPKQGAGIHLFFHGQGKGGGLKTLAPWRPVCRVNHLIAINMQFLDGDNLSDTGGKVKAAMQAVEQVTADYHIIPGRGIIASFSGGGLPHALYASQASRNGPDTLWPFTCMALYDTNYWSSLNPTRKMCYFVGLGEKEWHKGMPELGSTQTARAAELFRSARRAGYDFVFRVEKGKGHRISTQDRLAVSTMFYRFDLAFDLFVYEPQFTDAEIRSQARRANRLQLGAVLKSLESILSQTDLPGTEKKEAQLLQSLVRTRTAKVLKLAQSLAENDPLLFAQYQRPLGAQLADTPQETGWKKAVQLAHKKWSMSKVAIAAQAFCRMGPFLFNGGSPVLNARSVPTLKSILPVLGPESSYGKMIAEWLLLAPKS